MEIRFNVMGVERKKMVTAISEVLNAPTKYLGAPTFAYKIGGYHIDKNGTLTGGGAISEDANDRLIKELNQRGFVGEVADRGDAAELESRTYQAELRDPDCPDRMEVFGADDDEDALRQAYEFCDGDVVLLELFELDSDYNQIRSVGITPRADRLTIEVPLDGFTPEKLDNLTKLVNAKAPLVKAALGTDNLPVKQTADTLQFPWFKGEGAIDADHADAYATLVSLLCKTAIEKKRITAKEKDTPDNPKYAMRCFLLSLGFIGEEYKTARKVLLSRLAGNSSWKNGRKTEVAGDE